MFVPRGVYDHLPQNRPFLAETLNAGKAVAEPPEIGVNKLEPFFFE
jgi:hypothetical protein